MQLTTSTINLGELPAAAVDSVRTRLAWMERLDTAPHITKACAALASEAEVAKGSLYRLYRKWVDSGKNWEALLDRRLVSKTWHRSQPMGLPHDFLWHFKALCESNQRGSRSAYRLLLRQLDEWRSGRGRAIPGYQYPPENQSGKDFPHGWGYRNLMNHLPNDVELAAARLGRSAAKELLPSVLTTRVNLYPFAEIQFDDMWHDFLVNVLGQRSARRLLEFGAIDTFSGYFLPPGLKARVTDEVTQKNKLLNGRDFRLYVAYILTVFGYHPKGTILNMENATASIPTAMIDTIKLLTNGLVTVTKSAMDGRAAFPMHYGAMPKGNPRQKALKECMGNLIHNETAFLLGNVGLDRNHSPAELHGRNKENDLLLAISTLKPHLADSLKFGFLSFPDAVQAVLEIYDRVNRRPDHRIEGFWEAGLRVEEIRLSRSIEQWIPLADIKKLPEQEQQSIAAVVSADEELKRVRLMTPKEVIEREQSQLIRLPFSCLPNLLGKEEGVVKQVRQGLFHIENQELGERKFLAQIKDASGFPRLIDNGTPCRVFLNPFVPDRLILADPETNEFLGECGPWNRVDRADVDAIYHQAGRTEKLFKDAVSEAGLRSSRSKVERQRHNAKVIRDSCNGDNLRPDGVDTASLLTEERFVEEDELETTNPLKELL